MHPKTARAQTFQSTPPPLRSGASQTVEIRPLSEFLIPSNYRIFRASQNANRWRLINQMFAKSLPVDGSNNFARGPVKSLCLAGA